VAYLYNYAGAPYKTQQRVRQVMDTFYNDTPAGQCGNVDCGQMAAWYVFSALGLYPVNPASGVYMIGSPVVTKAVLNLDAKKYKSHKFTVIAQNNSAKNVYVQSASLNGKPLDRAWLTHEQITSGGTLTLVMGSEPNLQWGQAPDVRPPATMPAGFRYPELPAPSVDKREVAALPIKVVCGDEEPVQGFAPDPNMVDGATNGKKVKIDTSAANAAPEGVYQSERYGQDFSYAFEVPKGSPYRVRLHFAEIFNSEPGSRVEDISLNGQVVLKDFDILKTAGAMNKAVVKEFDNVAPDDQGKIVIRIAAASRSPDKNAKICGIEILKGGQ
jgi:hypothetical protein